MIKILSEKGREDLANEIIVSLGGGIGQIQDAACLIIEQIECFKNGGPVLATGKAIHKNIAQQIDEAIVIDEKDKHDNDDEKMKKKRKRSRSPSHPSHKEEKKYKQKEREKERSVSRNNNNNHNSKSDVIIVVENNNNKVDPSKNRSIRDKTGTKIINEILIPEHLMFVFSGRNAELLQTIKEKTGTVIKIQEDNKAKTYDNLNAKILTLEGTPSQNCQALQIISDTIIKIEWR